MKKSELKVLKADIINAVREMPYGVYAKTSVIAHKLRPNAVFDTEDLFELEEAVISLDRANEIVIDKLNHFNKVEGLPYNLGFYKRMNKGIVENGCGQVEFSLVEANYREVIKGIIDLRTGNIVIDDMKKEKGCEVFEISEADRCMLSELFLLNDFCEESREIRTDDLIIADGIRWNVSVYDENYDSKEIYGVVSDISEIPFDGARELFRIVHSIITDEF